MDDEVPWGVGLLIHWDNLNKRGWLGNLGVVNMMSVNNDVLSEISFTV
jgi:hypothetical protein